MIKPQGWEELRVQLKELSGELWLPLQQYLGHYRDETWDILELCMEKYGD